MSTIHGRLERLEKTRGTPDAIDITADEFIDMSLCVITNWMPDGWLDAETAAAVQLWKAGVGDAEALKTRLEKMLEPWMEEQSRLHAEREAERMRTRR